MIADILVKNWFIFATDYYLLYNTDWRTYKTISSEFVKTGIVG